MRAIYIVIVYKVHADINLHLKTCVLTGVLCLKFLINKSNT